MNKGLPPELICAFPHIKQHFLITEAAPHNNQNLDGYWLSGFASGEGSFQVDIKENKNLNHGYQVLLRFSIGQQARDQQLLISFIDYLAAARVGKFKKK